MLSTKGGRQGKGEGEGRRLGVGGWKGFPRRRRRRQGRRVVGGEVGGGCGKQGFDDRGGRNCRGKEYKGVGMKSQLQSEPCNTKDGDRQEMVSSKRLCIQHLAMNVPCAESKEEGMTFVFNDSIGE
eukprot:scaffold9909_cov102-Amphora_coffeaeformis.AAC.1